MNEAEQNQWLQGELFELEQKFKRYHDRNDLKEAFDMCILWNIPLPSWIADGIDDLFGSPMFNRHRNLMTRAYSAGNLGALKDMVYWCTKCKQPLPKWANNALFEALSALMNSNRDYLKKWAAWARRYRQDIKDYEIYEDVKDALEHGATWSQDSESYVYKIVAGIRANKAQIDRDDGLYSIEKTYKRVNQRLKENPYRYTLLKTYQRRSDDRVYNVDLWRWIENGIKSGKPKRKKTINNQ